MTDPVPHRRQPPSPLVFSPNSVLSSAPPSTNGTGSNHGSGSNTVSMPFVRRHVTRRLKAAKAECDKELQRVTNNITTFFEDNLRDGDHETHRELRDRERERERDRDRDSQNGEPLREAFVLNAADLRSALQTDESSSDGGYEAEVEYSRHSRQQCAPPDEDNHTGPTLAHWASSPGLLTASSALSSPASLRRQNTLPRDKPLSTSASSNDVNFGSAVATVPLPESCSGRKQANVVVPTSWSMQRISRRLSRTIHIPTRSGPSAQSSRSTSRSRSPLPPNTSTTSHGSFSEHFVGTPPTLSANRRSSRILVDDPIDPIMTALYDIIALSTDIVDMTVTQLTAQPKVCETLVQRVQNIGKAWDEHPDWHGRNWYVQVLLAVASLSRVVEWWEAEKQFWHFDDNDDEQDEPLTFVTKPADEPNPVLSSSALRKHVTELDSSNFFLEDNKLRLAKPLTQGRRSRDEQPKILSSPIPQREQERNTRGASKLQDNNESARVLATERLRLQAETAQNQNVILELNLDGDHFKWANYAWRVVVGTDPDELSGNRISHLLCPGDWNVFTDATQRLQEDDSRTVEVRFKLQIEPEVEREQSSGKLYQQMEGKGMLMFDREDGQPTHTMWVVKPIAPPRYEHDSPSVTMASGDMEEEFFDSGTGGQHPSVPITPFSFNEPFSTDLILCRICESRIPQWYFEKHSETCVEVHRLEAEIAECNESISELRNTIRDLCSALDGSSPVAVPEYRGMPIFTPSTSPIIPSPLQLFRVNKLQRMSVKKIQRRLLDQLEEILQVALEVSMPSLKEEESKEPIERQRLLSPGSERKMSQVRNWNKPSTQDAALGQLVQDAERVMRQKIDNVVRMQNTIRYSEKIWHEWEEKVEHLLATASDSESDGSGDGDEDNRDNHRNRKSDTQDGDDASSTTSEYALDGDRPSSEPTPMASSSLIHSAESVGHASSSISVPPLIPRQIMHTRSSTPSSVSSPLALAAPIMASSSPEDALPHMSLDDGPISLKVKAGKSTPSLLEPKLLITPPMSPKILTRETSARRAHRRHSTANPMFSPTLSSGPLSPRQPSAAPLSRTTPTSIKDFDIIKPISKGAFGSVFLAKKKVTGDYYAIKVLKKADMIAKNQITNVKAERMILMKQAESPFVAKLYFTFQSKDNLYLVMEYLNGGDCAALIKSLGSLPEEWTKNYIAEVVLGLEYLHQRGVVHRDLKPDNLLIDQHGHLKLTDFGLSRIGLLGRQTRENQMGRLHTRYNSRSRPPSMDATYLSSPLVYADVNAGGSYFNQRTNPVSRIGNPPHLPPTDDVSESSGSESLSGLHARRSIKANESPLQSFVMELTNDLRSHSNLVSGTPPGEQKFVGTPDYLAPETILGLRGDDATVDWWALGVITYEFLYGIPPFHAETPEKVFENILSGHIEWHDDWIEFREATRDFMKRLMTLDTAHRLGANGAEEVKAHPFFEGIEWNKVTTSEAAFIPQISDPESTDYFDPRGAIPQLFHDDDSVAVSNTSDSPIAEQGVPVPSPSLPISAGISREVSTSGSDDFGSFSFKNLPILKQANDDVIRKLKTDQMTPITHTLTEPTGFHSRKRSISQRLKKPPSVVTTLDQKGMIVNPPSPATSTSSIASSPSHASAQPSTPCSSAGHSRKPSEYVERFKYHHMDGERRGSVSSRLRTASVSSAGDGSGSGSENWTSSLGHGSNYFECNTPPSSVHSIDLRKGPDPSDRAVTCLLAEDNPITAKIIETLLIRLGCRCVVVADGSEAVGVAMGDIKFDCILMDLHMPFLDGESAARYIKSTNNKNTMTPIIAVSAYSAADPNETSNVFAASLSKPLQKANLLAVMRRLGFKTSTVQHGAETTKLTASFSNS